LKNLSCRKINFSNIKDIGQHLPALTSEKTLDQWLSWLQQLHPSTIDLSLQRIHLVAKRLDLLQSSSSISHQHSASFNSQINNRKVHVVTVAGTNGKGSCVHTLEQLLLLTGHSVGAYTSPHFSNYHERIRINGRAVSDQLICQAFVVIEAVRENVSLTYFEFSTLAALWIFKQQAVSYVLLEVGLGGRLDAVNIIDPDVAVITSIDLDHQEWLGHDRNTISREKLGIARTGRPLVIAETRLTPHMIEASKNYPCLLADRDFHIQAVDTERSILYCPNYPQGIGVTRLNLTASSVLAALCASHFLSLELPVEDIEKLLPTLELPGRFDQQRVSGKRVILDVAHNPAAAIQLSKRLVSMPVKGRTVAVVAIMANKDIPSMLSVLFDQIEHWYLGGLQNNSRAASASDLAHYLSGERCSVSQFSSAEDAFNEALFTITEDDRIVVFGSFFTVSAVQSVIETLRTQSGLGVS
jgi:dihydrofolate synthase/folylpolyglutamate synthase